MKHFLVEITYTLPIEKISEITPLHRAFLQTGYDQHLLLMSGPQNPREGGIVIAKAETKEIIETFFQKDPYNINKMATYRIVEFEPVLHASILDNWCQ